MKSRIPALLFTMFACGKRVVEPTSRKRSESSYTQKYSLLFFPLFNLLHPLRLLPSGCARVRKRATAARAGARAREGEVN
jgi:hypothetical protein